MKITEWTKTGSKVMAIALMFLMASSPVPCNADASNISFNEGNKPQPVVSYDPGSQTQETEQPAGKNAPLAPNENPLSPAGQAPAGDTTSAVEVRTDVPGDYDAAYSKLSEADRKAFGEFVDDLFVKAFQDAAKKEGMEKISEQDPVKFIAEYLADSQNAKTLANYAETLMADPKMTDKLRSYVSDLLVSEKQSESAEADRGANRFLKTFEERMAEFAGTSGTRPVNDIVPRNVAHAPGSHPASYRGWIMDRIDQAHQNLQEEALLQPFDHAPALDEDKTAVQVPEVSERTVREKYHILDSVFIGKDFIKTQKMASPPEDLHPYLKWVLYARNLTAENLSRYVQTRKKMLELYKRAKEGDGKIRYKGKVYRAFLPKTFEAAGNYELIQMIRG